MTAVASAQRIAGIGIFAAIIVVLQILGSFIQFGTVAISLVLVPIVIGAALYGKAAGAGLGGVFGLVVLGMSIGGVDVGGHMLWAANPVATTLVIMLRGILAGGAAGLVYGLISKKNKFAGVIGAAIICPVVNTGLFLLAMYFIFPDFLTLWAGAATAVYFLFIGLAGVNFLIEMVVNIVLSPTIVRIINAVKR